MDDQRTNREGRGVTPGWEFVGIVFESDPIEVYGLNPWGFKWHDLKQEPIVVAHPQYSSQRHEMHRYEIKCGEKVIEFAAGEFSNLVYGFYVPSEKIPTT
jgi:hypothetical protein